MKSYIALKNKPVIPKFFTRNISNSPNRCGSGIQLTSKRVLHSVHNLPTSSSLTFFQNGFSLPKADNCLPWYSCQEKNMLSNSLSAVIWDKSVRGILFDAAEAISRIQNDQGTQQGSLTILWNFCKQRVVWHPKTLRTLLKFPIRLQWYNSHVGMSYMYANVHSFSFKFSSILLYKRPLAAYNACR